MKIDLDYIKQILTKAQSIEKSVFRIHDLVDNKDEIDDEKFVFHMQIMADKELIVKDSDNSSDIGISRASNGEVFWSISWLRLTSTGHDFIEALTNDTVWRKIKKELKEPSISTLLSVALRLLSKTIENKG